MCTLALGGSPYIELKAAPLQLFHTLLLILSSRVLNIRSPLPLSPDSPSDRSPGGSSWTLSVVKRPEAVPKLIIKLHHD